MKNKRIEQIKNLPQRDVTWVVLNRLAPVWIDEDGGLPYRPRALVVVEDGGLMRYHEIFRTAEVSSKAVLESLYLAMQGKAMSDEEWEAIKNDVTEEQMALLSESSQPCRPSRLVVEGMALADSISPELKKLGIECSGKPRIPQGDEIIRLMGESFAEGGPEFGLSAIQGMSAFNIQEFYSAAFGFYEAAPWKWLANTHVIECHYSGDEKPYLVCVMGNGRQDIGISVYVDQAQFDLFSQNKNPLTLLRKRFDKPIQSVTFVEAHEGMSFADLDEIERLNYPVADEDAYPLVIKFAPPETRLEPTFEDMTRLSAILRAIPAFVKDHIQAEGRLPRPAQATLDLPDIYAGHTISFRFPVMDEEAILTPDFEEKGLVDEESFEKYLVAEFKKRAPFKVYLSSSAIGYLREAGVKTRNAREFMAVDAFAPEELDNETTLPKVDQIILNDEIEQFDGVMCALEINHQTVLFPVTNLDAKDARLPLRREISAYQFLRWCNTSIETDDEFFEDDILSGVSQEDLMAALEKLSKMMGNAPKSPKKTSGKKRKTS